MNHAELCRDSREQADKAQKWEGMDGATAFLLINRHADNWDDIREQMEAWRRAAVAQAVRRCAEAIYAWARVDDRHEKMLADIRAEFPEAFK